MSYARPVYSKETYRGWDRAEKKHAEYLKSHTHETEQVYKVNDLYIFCTQRKYDECLKRNGAFQDTYIISVWEDETRKDTEKCLTHNIYRTADEANKAFIFWKQQCAI